MGKSILEVLLKGTDQLSQPTSKAVDATDSLTEAMIKLIKAEKQAVINKDAETHFKQMSQAEKDAALEAYNLSKATTESKSSFGNLAGGINEVVQELTGLNLAQISIVGGLGMVANEARKTFAEYNDYVETMDKLSMSTGLSVEETSKIVQVADDFRVEQDAMTNAMNMAVQNGYIPSIDNLARLADEYVNASDKTEATDKLQKEFGKQWKELVPLLEQGGDAIRKAYGEMNGGLVVTDKAVQDAREYAKAMDGLNDSWTSAKYELMKGIVPGLTDFIEKATGAQKAAEEGGYTWTRNIPLLGMFATGWQIATYKIEDNTNKTKENTGAAKENANQIKHTGDQADGASGDLDNLNLSMRGVGVTYQDFNPILKANIDLTTQQREDFNGIAEATAKIDEATKNYEQTLKDWQGGVGSQLAGMLDENKLKTDKYKDALGIIDKTMGTNLKTESDQKDALKDLADKYNTGKITGDEFGKKLVEIRDQFAPLNDKIAEAKTKLDELYAQIDKFSDLSINVNVNYSENGGSTGGSMGYTGQSGDANGNVSTERALGGPVGAGTYIVGENGPEVLQLNPGSSGNVINHYNATYNVNAHYPMQRPGSVRDDIIALTMRHNIGASRWMA